MKNVSLNALLYFFPHFSFSLYIPRREKKIKRREENIFQLWHIKQKMPWQQVSNASSLSSSRRLEEEWKIKRKKFFYLVHLLFVSLLYLFYCYFASYFTKVYRYRCECVCINATKKIISQSHLFAIWKRRRHRATAFSIKWREMSLFVE